jgi:hypothetical protein
MKLSTLVIFISFPPGRNHLRRFGYFSFPRISECTGKRCSFFFEKISFPSATTSKTPPPDLISFASTPDLSRITPARPAAWG